MPEKEESLQISLEIKYTDTIILFRAIVRWISSIIRRVVNKETFKKFSKFNYLNYIVHTPFPRATYPRVKYCRDNPRLPLSRSIRPIDRRTRCANRRPQLQRSCMYRLRGCTHVRRTRERKRAREKDIRALCYIRVRYRAYVSRFTHKFSFVRRCAGFRTRAAHRVHAHSCTRALMHIHTHK